MSKKYSKRELEEILQGLEDIMIINDYNDRYVKVNIGIVGGSSLILKGVEARKYTRDVDAVLIDEFKDGGSKLSELDKLITDLNMPKIINSRFTVFESRVLVEHESEWVSVFKGKNGFLEAYSASNETVVAMKLYSLSEKDRDSDLEDINSDYILENTDPKVVKELIEELITYISLVEKHEPIREEYRIWLKKQKEHNSNK